MNLLRLAGFANEPKREQVGQEGMAALVLAAEQAIRAGVVFSTDFWMGCCDYEREALAQAGDRVAAGRAVLHGAAAQGLQQAAMIAATQDGGQALKAVKDAEEVALNSLAAQRLNQQALGESKFVSAPTSVVAINEVDLPAGVRQ